ncbi:MAG: hypothetical protein KBC15_01840 [Candidatus Levybacteria bacterium]|nr:hypothetical protein [Candidatus Levybacteria bacterium]
MNYHFLSLGELTGDWGDPSPTKWVFCLAGIAIWIIVVIIAFPKKKD